MQIKLSNGNSKIGRDTLILNLNSATDCPTKKLGMCRIHKICYALQPEMRYKDRVLKHRRQQAKIWNSTTAKKLAKMIIDVAHTKHKHPIKYLRVSESGDFRHQADVRKLSVIADKLKQHRIKVYTYTSRRDLNFDNLSKNLVVSGSGFMIHNNFIAVRNYSGKHLRCKANCRICDFCKKRNHLTIENQFHGVAFNYLKRRKNGSKKSKSRD